MYPPNVPTDSRNTPMDAYIPIASLVLSIASFLIAWQAEQRARAAAAKADAADEKAENYKKLALQIQERIAETQERSGNIHVAEQERAKQVRERPTLTISIERIENGREVQLTNDSEAIALNVSLETFGGEDPNDMGQFPIKKIGPKRNVILTYWLHQQSSNFFGAVVRWENKQGEKFDDKYEIRLG